MGLEWKRSIFSQPFSPRKTSTICIGPGRTGTLGPKPLTVSDTRFKPGFDLIEYQRFRLIHFIQICGSLKPISIQSGYRDGNGLGSGRFDQCCKLV